MFTSQLILEEENELRKLLITEQIDHNDNPAFISQNNSLFDLQFEESPQTPSPKEEPLFFNFPIENIEDQVSLATPDKK